MNDNALKLSSEYNGSKVLEMVFIKVKNNKHKLSLAKTNKRLFRLNLANQVTLHYGKRRSALKELAFTEQSKVEKIHQSDKGVKLKAYFGLKLSNLNFLHSATINDLQIFAKDALKQEMFYQALNHLTFVKTGRHLCLSKESFDIQPKFLLKKNQTTEVQTPLKLLQESAFKSQLSLPRNMDNYLQYQLYDEQRIHSFSNTTIKAHQDKMPLPPVIEIQEDKNECTESSPHINFERKSFYHRRSTEPVNKSSLTKKMKKNRFGQGYMEIATPKGEENKSSDGSSSQNRGSFKKARNSKYKRNRSASSKRSSDSGGNSLISDNEHGILPLSSKMRRMEDHNKPAE